MPELGPANVELRNPDVRRERSDASLNVILKWGLGLAFGIVVIHLALWWLFDYFLLRENVEKESAFAVAVQERNEATVPSQPAQSLLEGIRPNNPDHTISHWRPGSGDAKGETAEREPAYEWVDAKAGVV